MNDLGFVADAPDVGFVPDSTKTNDLGFVPDKPEIAPETEQKPSFLQRLDRLTRPPTEFYGDDPDELIRAAEKAQNTPIVPPKVIEKAIEYDPTVQLYKRLPLPPSVKEFGQGAKETVAEGLSGMTTGPGIATLPAFAIPGVGEGLAMGLGAKGVGEGLGRLSAAQTPKEAGSAVGEIGLGAGMLLPGAVKAAKDIGLPKAAAAAEKTAKGTSEKAQKEVKDTKALEGEPESNKDSTGPEVAPTTAAESRQNAATKSPEQIQAELDAVRAEIDALPKPGPEATPEQRMAYLTAKTELSNKAGFLKEAQDVQKEATQPTPTAGYRVKLSGGDKFHSDISGVIADVKNDGRILEVIKDGDDFPTRVTVEDYKNAAYEASQKTPSEAPALEVNPVIRKGLTLEETKAHVEEANRNRPLGKSWQEIEQMQGGKIKPLPTKVTEGALGEAGMGAAKIGEALPSHMAGLTEVVKNLPTTGKPEVSKAFSLGESLTKMKDTVDSTLEGLKAAGEYLKKRLVGKPEVTDWRRMLGDRHLALSESAVNARRFMQATEKKIPRKELREAIADWVDTGGDLTKLKQAAVETKPIYRKGYERAQNLTPDELHLAQNLRNYFDSRLDDAINAGILEGGIENYIHRIYEADSPFKQAVLNELRSGIFTGKPALAKQRVFEYDFEAEKAGKRPIKDFAKRVAAYDLALNKAIADRQAIKQMMEMKMPDGRPMIDTAGNGKVIEGPTGETDATLINRSAKKFDETDPKANRGDYKSYDHPALRKWKWVAQDEAGKPIFVQGDVLVHPDAMKQVSVLFDRSRIRQNPLLRTMQDVSSTVKQTMLDLSLFHQVQIAVHAAEHKTWGPIKEIDFTNPDVRGLIKGGAVVGETTGRELFSEGLAGSSLTKHIPWVGKRVQAYQDYLFGDFIPRIKVAMGLHALERNKARFPELSKEELYQLTANQMNAAFGELNYEMLGRSKTTQDVLRLTLLAPDFLEARTRFVGQGGTKYGAEQRNALILGAVSMYFFARIANKIINDEWHLEPKNAFSIIYKGKSYGLRTVQGDLIHAATEPGQFTNHRLNPVYAKPALEFATGRDYFGRKRDAKDKLKDLALTPVPISLRGIYSGQEQNLLESALNSMGIVTKRDSPSSDMAKKAQEWKKENKVTNEPGEFIYDSDKDPYRQIRLAAERGDVANVRSEIDRAKLESGLTSKKIAEHFRLSSLHNFTGSAKNEKKFVASLTADERKIYNDAREERRRIMKLVLEAMQ